jgi:hypothetical protein
MFFRNVHYYNSHIPQDRILQFRFGTSYQRSSGCTPPEELPQRSKIVGEFYVRFEVSTAVTMKSGVFWDVTPCGSCKNRRFGGT